MLYLEPLSSTLFDNMKKNIMDWMTSSHSKHHPDLYVILITESRSVLFIIQDSTDTVIVVNCKIYSVCEIRICVLIFLKYYVFYMYSIIDSQYISVIVTNNEYCAIL